MVLMDLLMMILFASRCNFLATLPFSISFFAVWEKLTPRGKKNIVKGRSYNFLQNELTRQKKYYKLTNILTKAQLKEEREALKQRVHHSRN